MLRLLLILAGVVVLVQLNDAKPLDQAIVAVALASVLAFVWSRLSVRNLTIRRIPTVEHASVGELFSEQLTLANNSVVPKPWLEVLDFSSLPGHAAGQVVRVKARDQFTGRREASALTGGNITWVRFGFDPVIRSAYFLEP